MTFLTILAWFGFILAGSFTLLRIACWATYSDIDRRIDRLSGKVTVFPIKVPGLITIFCFAFLLAGWLH